MTIHTALKKVDILSKGELEHCIQRMNMEIDYYKFCIQHYPPDRLKSCGLPYMDRLKQQRQIFINHLKKYDSQ
jgi:hypothetical protein